MLRITTLLVLLGLSTSVFSQRLERLSVEKIMRDPIWIGTSPSSHFWSHDGSKLYFLWNPEKNADDSTYYISLKERKPVKASLAEKQSLISTGSATYNKQRTAYTYSKDGDIFFVQVKPARSKRVTQTVDFESNPQFSFNEQRIVYNRNGSLYSWDIGSGETVQLTNAVTSGGRGDRQERESANAQEEWLRHDQLEYFQVLRERKARREEAESYSKNARPKTLRSIPAEGRSLQSLNISPDGRFITYRLFKPATGNKNTIVPNYVTESGFTTDIPGRTKVGSLQGSSEFFVYDREMDTILRIGMDSIPGIRDLPDYLADYPKKLEERKKKDANRAVSVSFTSWSPDGTRLLMDIRSEDNKDRWLMLLDPTTGNYKTVDRQRDEAWIAGPGIGFGRLGWIDENTLWFQSEATGYSHLYLYDVSSGTKRALTEGKYEVQQAQLSKSKKYFYITTNEVHPGEQHFYRLAIADGRKERLTTMTGANQVSLSPDEKTLAILHSYSNKPWELYLQENKPGGKIEQITHQAMSEEFSSYPWRDPEVITFAARDGETVYARLYKPANPHPSKPAVVFVHGAGYLQNAHKWWSTYFREYMFNNLLAENGYYVLDIDYRGSAGYGRNWRTGIYRHMGGKDLTDQVDGVRWLQLTYGINPSNVGIYGGSYGGFITLMAMFTEPDVFAAGAGLRSVTDWSNYNHGYTSNILNEPHNDSIAYRRSSPLYFAEGLKGHLLMLHGMIDVNVHFQDIVELSQRLIELGKDNWELAVYPLEDHGFVEPSSWTDEYKRIFKLFERVLK